ncbi:EG45-like domain containing protein [Beta vulgaris subsp. vulgaris]|uniref:EG45-like domain containing protein n=1 Tax=Beta vulgaris subsp. vulgaris TaxID=3555 RepID=UPI0020376733|nr:EG45-like domain containing protein [Beta vulgaris subsp. vulgaris]
MGMKALLLATFVLSLAITVANASVGLAVYHTHNTPSACYGNQDHGPWITGVSGALWNNRGACGRYYWVTCIGGANLAPHPCKRGSVLVRVTDFCASCAGDLNLSQQAFNQIADTRAGKIRVRYDPA